MTLKFVRVVEVVDVHMFVSSIEVQRFLSYCVDRGKNLAMMPKTILSLRCRGQ